MAGFNNPVVGGGDDLIRPAIQSPDYTPGVSGWTINRDGTVEFNNGTFRGTIVNGGLFVYNGTPAAGTLIVAISPTAGTDAFGNTYTAGISLAQTVASGSPGAIVFNDGQAIPAAISEFLQAGISILEMRGSAGNCKIQLIRNNTGDGVIILEGTDHFIIDAGNGVAGTSSIDSNLGALEINGHGLGPGWRFGAGQVGKYYSEQLSLAPAAGTNVPNNTDTIITPGTSQAIHSDYGTAWVGNTWTCPVDGDYNFTMPLQGLPAASPRVYGRIVINGNIVLSSDGAIGGQGPTVSGTLALTAGDTMQVHVFQNSGAAVALGAQARIHIRREL